MFDSNPIQGDQLSALMSFCKTSLRIDLADADFSVGSLITEVPIGGDVAWT